MTGDGGWKDPDAPRQWLVIVPLLAIAAGFAIVLAVNGQWLVLAVVVGATALSVWMSWQTGKPLWPGGPRRRM